MKIIAKKQTNTPNYGMCSDGYTKKSGAPTSYMVMLEGEKIWRRVMLWQFSNNGTLFIRYKGENKVIDL